MFLSWEAESLRDGTLAILTVSLNSGREGAGTETSQAQPKREKKRGVGSVTSFKPAA